MNQRPSGYEPDELPGCSIPRRFIGGQLSVVSWISFGFVIDIHRLSLDWLYCWIGWKTWRRPTLPCLEAQYHGRWGFSRPSSGWDRVRAPREDHQVVQPIRSHRSSVVCCMPLGLTQGSVSKARQAGGWKVLVRFVCVRFVRAEPLRMISMHGEPALLFVPCFLATDN